MTKRHKDGSCVLQLSSTVPVSRDLKRSERGKDVGACKIFVAALASARHWLAMVQGRRLRLLTVLGLVCLLPILSLIYTYRTYHPSRTRGSRVAVVAEPVAGDGGDEGRGRAIGSAPTRALARLDSTPAPVRNSAPPANMSAKTAVENAIANRKNRTVIFSKASDLIGFLRPSRIPSPAD